MCRFKRLLFLSFLSLCLIGKVSLFAQVSIGGTPPSFSSIRDASPISQQGVQQTLSPAPLIELPVTFDVAKLKAEDKINEQYGWPPRLGVTIPVNNLDLFQKGVWTTLTDGQKICRLSLQAKGATALSLYYSQFYIPKGAKLYIYNKDKTHVIGAFTYDNNLGRKAFATEYVAGDEVVIEYVASAEALIEPAAKKIASQGAYKLLQPAIDVKERDDVPIVIISEVGYAYSDKVVVTKKPATGGITQQALNESGSCMVNINCSEGQDWQVEKNSVSRLIIFKEGGQYYCTGTLINNTGRDFTPYIITAFHCFENATAEDIQKTIYYFHYEQPGCSNSSIDPPSKTIAGSSRLVNIPIKDNSDGALVVLNEQIPADWDLYWSGWDRRNDPLNSGVGIHHPAGDVMKISTVPIPAASGKWPAAPYGGLNAHWMVYFAQTQNGFSTVQGGSSGSGLFNQDHRLVGTLTGGSADCSDPTGQTFYGKLWYHWDQCTDTTQKMQPYLDPINSNEEVIEGSFLTGSISANFNAVSTTVYAGEEAHFVNLSYGATTWDWEFPGGTPATSTDRNPVVIYKSPGVYTVKLTVNKGTPDELSREKKDIITIIQKSEQCPAESFKLGTGTAQAQFPLGLATKQAYSAAIYKYTELPRSGIIDSLYYNPGLGGVAARRELRIYMKEVADSTFAVTDTWDNAITGAQLVFWEPGYTSPPKLAAFRLKTPFAYSGTKHLMILVSAVNNDETPLNSSNCSYTNVQNSHMQWESTSLDPLTGNGTINSNRPNIQIVFKAGDCARPPKAQFEMMANPYFAESFDSYTFPPTGWEVTKPGASPNKWELANVLTNPFSQHEPDNIMSATVTPNARATDTWLISKNIVLKSTTSNIQFFVGFNPMKAEDLSLTFYISTDGKNTWKEIWTTPKVYAAWDWYKVTGNLRQHAGHSVYFAWRVHGGANLNGDYIALDGIKIFEDLSVANIFEGERVYFTDKSAGPPIHLKWNLPGGTPATGTTSTIQSTYLTEGLYNAGLYVDNNMGKDSVLLNGVINVTARQPVARIVSSGGYTRAENYHSFIPVGGTVSYKDTSLYIPTTWAWSFDGGTPATSAHRKETVRYDTEGEYNTSLTVANTKGSNNIVINNSVKVGGTDRIWNMPQDDKGEDLFLYGEEGDGYLTGTCIIKTDKYAEKFNAPQEPVKISAVDIRFVIEGKKVTGEKLTVSIYNVSPKMKAYPHLAITSVDLPIQQITSEAYTTITFPEPVIVSEGYYVVVEGFSTLKTKIAISSSTLSFYSWNSAYAYHLETWYSMPEYAGNGIGTALNVVPTVTYLRLEVKPQTSYTVVFSDTTKKMLHIASNTAWTATTTQPWIMLNKSGASGNDSIAFHCAPNTDNLDRHGVIMLSGGSGLLRRIFVTQTTGDSILGLKAALKEDFLSVQLKWGASALNTQEEQQAAGVVLPTITNNVLVEQESRPMSKEIVRSGNPPISTQSAQQALSWTNGVYHKQYYYTGTKHYQVASLFYPEDLSQYHGGSLNVIEFYPNGPATFRLLIYQNEVLVLDSALTNVKIQMNNRINIEHKGVMIDANKSLRITLDILAPALSGAICYDAGPAVVGKGNLLNNNIEAGLWAPLSAFETFETSGNWMLSGYVKMQNAPSNYYRIYRNGEMIGETDKTNFIDQRIITSGDYCYQVSKVFNADDSESPKSNQACVVIKPVLVVAALNVSLDYGYAMPTPEDLGKLMAWDWGAVQGKVTITKQPTISIRSDITPTSPAGIYPGGVEISDMRIENPQLYNIRYIPATFNHTRRKVEIVGSEDTKKAYGDPDPVSIPYVANNIVSGEQLAGNLSRKAGEGVGTYLIEKGTLDELNNPNYSITVSPSMVFSITKRPVTVTPNESGKIYGNPDPSMLTYTVKNGLANEPLKGLLMRENGENVGKYNIVQGQVDNIRNQNYDITFKQGIQFTINPREITVVPDAVFKSYGTPDPVIPYKVAGILNNDLLQGSLVRVQGEDAGQYIISLGTLSAGDNYNLNFVPGTFTIRPANLFVQADNLNIPLGSILPKPTYTMNGYKAEDETMLRSIINNSIYINAASKPSAGVYDILFDTKFVHNNYEATFAPGKLTISGTPVTAFVPGSSNPENATFMPEGATYIKVFTRNGVLVYEGKDAWDGNTKQGKVEAGIYYYIANMADGSVLKGSVEVYKL